MSLSPSVGGSACQTAFWIHRAFERERKVDRLCSSPRKVWADDHRQDKGDFDGPNAARTFSEIAVRFHWQMRKILVWRRFLERNELFSGQVEVK
jgi:hypothetical protein